MESKSPRLAPLDESEWTDEVRAVLEPTKSLSGGRVFNIFATLAHHPKLLKRWLLFGDQVLSRSTLGARERELVILRTGWLCDAEYEWAQHVVIGKLAGLSDVEIQRVMHGADAPGWSAAEAALLRATDELHADKRIADTTWRELGQHFTTQQCLDLIFAVGQYTLVSMALRSLGVELDPGLSGFPADAPARR